VSMIFTLVLVPVLYVVVERRHERRAARRAHEEEAVLPMPAKHPARIAAMTAAVGAVVMLAISITPNRGTAQTASPGERSYLRASLALRSQQDDTRIRLTLDDAVALAMKQGYASKLANARVAAADAHERGATTDLLPQLAVTGNHLRSSGRTTIVIPQGALGNESSGSPLPANDRRFDQGAAALTYTQFSLTQPVTQLWRIRQAQGLASAQTRSAAAERSRTQADVRLAIERLYASVLIARAKEHAAELTMKAARRQSSDAQQAVASGNTVSASALGAKASALDAELAWTSAADSAADAESELRSALALKPGTRLELVAPELKTDSLLALDE